MMQHNAILSIRIKVFFLYAIRVLLLLAAIFFFYKTFEWMVFERYQLGGSIRGLDPDIDKQLGLDKVTDLSLSYEKAWIDAEVKFNKCMAIISLGFFIGTLFFRPAIKQIDFEG